MTDAKDILQALYAACVQAWARFRKRWKGGKSSDKYTASEVDKCFNRSLREVFAYDMKHENRNSRRELLLFGPHK